MKKISKVATASVLLFTLANPLAIFAENRVGNVSEASSNKTTQDLTISSEEINGDIVFHVTAVRDTYEAILYAKINGKNYTYNLGNLKKGQVSKIVQPDASINNNNASISKESTKGRILPNTSAVRELVEKSVSCSNELNGNTIEAKVVYKVYELVEKQSTQNDGREYIPESTVKGSAIVKPEIQVKPEYKEVLGGAIVEPAVQPELPKAVVPAAPAPKAEEPAAPAPKAEEPTAPAPKAEEPTAPAPKAEEPTAPAPKAEEPAAPAPKVEEPSAPAPKAEEPAAPKEDTPSEEVTPKDEKLEEAKKDGKEVIEKIAASKLSEIEKVKDEAEKAKLEAKLKELKEAGLEAINNAKDHDAAVDVTDEYQTKIDEINVPGEELPAPNYNKDNLTNGRNEGTTIDNGSTAIGHGSGEATPTPTQPTTERSTTSTAPTQPASTSEGTSSFRNAPEVQVRTKKVVKRDLSNKTKQINIYYNLTALKDIAGALGESGGENMLTFPGNISKEDLKRAIEEKTKAQIEKLKKQGFKVVSTTDLDQIVEGGDSYDYVVEFTKESKSTLANNTGFRKAPLVQNRAKRSAEQKETVDVNVYFNLKTLPGIAGALDVDGDTTIKLPKDATVEQVKAAIQTKIAKVEKRGYNVIDAYFGAKTEHGYDFVVEFKK